MPNKGPKRYSLVMLSPYQGVHDSRLSLNL